MFSIFLIQVTLYFKSEHFKTAIPVAITAMLVMYTLNSSVSSKLPQTSSIKFMDIWIVYGLFIHFLILILLVLIEHLPGQSSVVFIEKSKNQQYRAISKKEVVTIFAQKILLGFEVLFVVLYFVAAYCINQLPPE